jgi:hypothetical protein
MINKICDICNEYAIDTWSLVITDVKDKKYEISGDLKCINQIEDKYKQIKNVNKLTVDQILINLNLKRI